MRRVHHPDARLYEESELPKEKALKQSFRWLYLTKFNTDGLEDPIRDIYGNPEETSFTFSAARVKILEWAKGWKSKSLARMLEHVQHEKERSREEDPDFCMARSSNVSSLHHYFQKAFTADRFLEVFYWARPILDFEKSSPLGQYYLKHYATDIYSNLAVQVKLHDDLIEGDRRTEIQCSWTDILSFWDEMASSQNYEGVDKGVFAVKRGIQKKRRIAASIQSIQDRLLFADRPPLRPRAATSTNETRKLNCFSLDLRFIQ
ncbi:hypothetical protein Egran_05768, partial [Elaphomyces granulatus]